MEQITVHAREMELLKSVFSVLISTYPEGASFFMWDQEKVIFKTSYKFEALKIEEGDTHKAGGVADQVIKSGKLKIINYEAGVYGVRVMFISAPIWADDESAIIGAWGLALPRRHPLASSFKYYAPIMANLLPEGGVLFITDREVYRHLQSSDKFDIPEINLQSPIPETSLQAMRTSKEVSMEVPESVYGVPALISASPMFDEDTGEIIASFGLILPRQLAGQLKQMAFALGKGLAGVSGAMQQITAASSEINQNQTQLHEEFQNVQNLTENIDQVMAFIKDISEQTNMLGLNAAIEAARAGDSGRGFGVVAEEIRKLADQSRKTVVKIKELTTHIQSSVEKTAKSSETVLQSVEETAAASQEVSASIEELASLSQELEKLAKAL